MAYADKCFYFDWGNREIKLEDFDKYDSISLRKRWYGEEGEIGVSIELWGKEKEGDEREEDSEIVLSRDNAMILANKLMRAVAELDADLYREGDLEDLRLLLDIFSDEVDDTGERVDEKNFIIPMPKKVVKELFHGNEYAKVYYVGEIKDGKLEVLAACPVLEDLWA